MGYVDQLNPEDGEYELVWSEISNEKTSNDTHKIFYLTEPLEPEVEECDHVYVEGLKFCAKCGKMREEV